MGLPEKAALLHISRFILLKLYFNFSATKLSSDYQRDVLVRNFLP